MSRLNEVLVANGWAGKPYMIMLQINGQERRLDGPTPLLDFLHSKEIDPRFIVVEHNGEIVRRTAYEGVTLDHGDNLELVHMMGGG